MSMNFEVAIESTKMKVGMFEGRSSITGELEPRWCVIDDWTEVDDPRSVPSYLVDLEFDR